ncbi:unnamed protein product [Caenorhabditis bovis]|uniref:Prolactin regulatory element-binding protein n=1 Tax=Caenorhabditis bovis TaxID=2654633 RepID=A0A8S1F7Z5_9PELO|nr:unnamed protein product [Caenorhabditis bovis]
MGIADFVEKRSKKAPPIIANSKIPAYCIKKIGARHLLLGGGGGASKTGVSNEIETYLLTSEDANPELGLKAECVDKFNTSTFATMNMDVISASVHEQDAKYVIAAGHDEYCDLYTTAGYKLSNDENSKLSFELKHVKRIKTDEHPNSSYQKCVRFDRNSKGRFFATGGADGHIRIWDALAAIKAEEGNAHPVQVIQAHKSDVDDIDFSYDSMTIISVGADGFAYIWSTQTGEKLLDLQFPIEIARGFKMRAVRCTSLGASSKNSVFVAAYNSISRASKDLASYVALWAFNAERKVARPVVVRLVAKGETISSLAVSDCGNFTAIGTMSGGVAVLDTHECRRIFYAPETHGIFVTGLEFLDRAASNICDDKSLAPVVPGPSSGYLATVVSLSADQSIQMHRVPFSKSRPLSEMVLLISIVSLIIAYISSFFV